MPGVFDWPGPYDTKEEAFAHALRWLVGWVRFEHTLELVVCEIDPADFAVYQQLCAAAEKRLRSEVAV